MATYKLGKQVVLMLNVTLLLVMIAYAYGAATKPFLSSSSSSLMRSEARKLIESNNMNITPYRRSGVSMRKANSKSKGGKKRKGGSKKNKNNKKNRRGGGKKKNTNRNHAMPNFTSSCECGKKFSNRIIGGVPTTRNEYPWQAAVFAGDYFCGGTLINDRFVMTAVHCIDGVKPKNVKVRLREHNLNKPGQSKEIEKEIKNIFAHKNYDSTRFKNDIALLEFKEPVIFPESASLRPICLPSSTDDLYVDKKVIATGWGATDPFTNAQPDLLQEVQLRVISEEVCETFYRGDIKKAMICAGKGNRNVCFGDSGGPLAYKNRDDRYEQIGITSFGLLCGQYIKEPSVFARVTSFMRWIQRKTRAATYCQGFSFPS